MKILIIAEKLPNLIGGYSARLYNLLRELSSEHEFSLITYAYPVDLPHIEKIKPLLASLDIVPLETPIRHKHSKTFWMLNAWRHAFFDPYPLRGQFPKTSLFQAIVKQKLQGETHASPGQFDLIEINQAYMNIMVNRQYIWRRQYLWRRQSIPRLFHAYDMLSSEANDVYLKLANSHKATHKFQAWLEWKKTKRIERNTLSKADLCVAVSEDDKTRFAKLANTPCMVVPNGVDIEYFSPHPERANKNILFMGSMNYPPNAEAVRWFSSSIFPRITAQTNDAHLHIVGWDPPSDILELNQQENITVTGIVEDIRPYLANSAVVVVPLKSGGGTRLKILDSWSMGKAVVSTRIGAEGLKAVHGQNILIADDNQAEASFANAVVRLLSDTALRTRLGISARQTVEAHYSWKTIASVMNSAYLNTVDIARHAKGRLEAHRHLS